MEKGFEERTWKMLEKEMAKTCKSEVNDHKRLAISSSPGNKA